MLHRKSVKTRVRKPIRRDVFALVLMLMLLFCRCMLMLSLFPAVVVIVAVADICVSAVACCFTGDIFVDDVVDFMCSG